MSLNDASWRRAHVKASYSERKLLEDLHLEELEKIRSQVVAAIELLPDAVACARTLRNLEESIKYRGGGGVVLRGEESVSGGKYHGRTEGQATKKH